MTWLVWRVCRPLVDRRAVRWAASAALAAGVVLGVNGGTAAQTPSVAYENGYLLPARGDVRVLFVFAEVNFRPCGGGFSQAPFAHPNWPEATLPLDKDDYFDPVIEGPPQAVLSDYYYQMSFGQYRVAGDYLPGIVTLDCLADLATPFSVISALNQRPSLYTAHGLALHDFDQWTPTGAGQVKLNQPDLKIDLLMIVWRNVNLTDGSECDHCFSGSIEGGTGQRIGYLQGVNFLGSFTEWSSGPSGRGVFVHEYMHTLFGGNNMHIGNGADIGSFHYRQSPWGMTAHHPSSSQVANGWDRDHLKWKPGWKQWFISALNVFRREVPGDISISTHPAGGTFILRDFVETGDAIRIRLPHIVWEEFAPKNQYLWIENHQMHSRFDVNGVEHPCQSRWTPGVYVQIQVGKDTTVGVDAVDLYPDSGRSWYPNALGSWLLPLSADGRRDWLYRFDRSAPPDRTVPCQWDNAGLAVEPARSLPNPFTGYSDLFFSADVDTMLTNPQPAPVTLIPIGNGLLMSGEPKLVLTEVVGDDVVRRLGNLAAQAFSVLNGNTRMSIATNPAPVPVYTRESQWGYDVVGPNQRAMEDWENRTIWLNGLSVQILRENVDGNGAVMVRVRWDEWTVDRDVRWTGNIVLRNDGADPRHRQSKIVVDEGRNLYLDRGLSPTIDFARTAVETVYPHGEPGIYPPGLPAESGRLFTDPTVMTVKAGTKIHLRRNARLWLQNGSTLVVEAGAEVQLEPGAAIVAGAGGGIPSIAGVVRSLGDLDGNGCVDRSDLGALLMEVFRGWQDPFHDLNEDGRVDFGDVATLMRFYSRPFGRPCAPQGTPLA